MIASERYCINSLGVILHQLLTGNDPTQTPFRFAPLHLQDRPALEGREALILQMLELDPARRPASVVMVKNELLRTGMVIGYIFGSIYLGFLCMLMAFLFIR